MKTTSGSEKVKKRGSADQKKLALQTGANLTRTTFRTSREMDFFSERELVTQTGHGVSEWPLVIAKELIDNALDACEEANIPPVIDVVVDAAGITVKDNGPGLPETTLQAAMDFTVRASNREAYVSPCRGAQGNALKTLLPMPWVVDPNHGKMIVMAHGKRHEIRCGADSISQRPVINDVVAEVCHATGTEVRLEWSHRAKEDNGDAFIMWPFHGLGPVDEFADSFRELIEGYAIFNPHTTIRLNWFGQMTTWVATDPSWQKWKPSQPTSAHWYELRHLERLIGAYITHDRERGEDRLVSDLLTEFDGLSGSAKQANILDKAGMRRVKLSELATDRLDSNRIAKLLSAMQGATRPVNPKRLGIIGEEHLKSRLLALGVQESSFNYSRRLAKDGLPWVLESAFGWLGPDAVDERKIYTGANWSAAIKNPFRSFGDTGEGLETALAKMRVTADEPVVVVLHLAHPRVEYTDRGKSALIIAG